MSLTSADQTASNFENKWTSIICDNTKFLEEWSHAILSINHATADQNRVLEHYIQYESAWKTIRLGVLDAAEANMASIMLPLSQAECAVDRTYVTVLTRWGDIIRAKGDWCAATKKYQLAASHCERTDRNNPPESWVTLLGSWSHLLSEWGQTLQQSADPSVELIESIRTEGASCSTERLQNIIKTMHRSPEHEQYEKCHADFNAFEESYKSYTMHWLNSFHGQKPVGKSPIKILMWRKFNPESGDPTLSPMHSNLVATYKTLVDGFERNL